MAEGVTVKKKSTARKVFRVLVFFSSLVVWFFYSYYTLDYSSGEPVLSTSAFILLILLAILNFRGRFVNFLKHLWGNKLLLAGLVGIVLGEFLYSKTELDLLTSLVQVSSVYLMAVSFYIRKRFLASGLISLTFASLFYAGVENFLDIFAWVSLALFSIVSLSAFVKDKLGGRNKN